MTGRRNPNHPLSPLCIAPQLRPSWRAPRPAFATVWNHDLTSVVPKRPHSCESRAAEATGNRLSRCLPRQRPQSFRLVGKPGSNMPAPEAPKSLTTLRFHNTEAPPNLHHTCPRDDPDATAQRSLLRHWRRSGAHVVQLWQCRPARLRDRSRKPFSLLTVITPWLL
jgi:hypothetical protein